MENDTRKYIASYMVVRTAVGVLGLALPVILIVGEYGFIRGPVDIRGSLSAYYHTSMRDYFVSILWVIAVLLITYMAAQWRSLDFALSTAAGIALLGVAVFPTTRIDLPDNAPACGVEPEPSGCAPMQQRIGEALCAHIHYTCAVAALILLGAIAFLFGWRERGSGSQTRLRWFHFGCCGAIALGLLVGLIGQVHDFKVWLLGPDYIAEVTTVTAFGLGWLVKGWALWQLLRSPPAI
jgi:hypothetical protein